LTERQKAVIVNKYKKTLAIICQSALL